MQGKGFWQRINSLLVFYGSELWQRRELVTLLLLLGLAVLIGQWKPIFGVVAFLAIVSSRYRYLISSLVRFGRRVRKFTNFSFPHMDLHIAPELVDSGDWEELARQCTEVLRALQEFFGFPLKHRLTVFVFPTMVELNRLFQQMAGARALPRGDAILLAWDSWQATKLPQEILRHEIAHLFSYRLGKGAPAFKREGLATWLQRSEEGKPIDFCALAEILGGNDRPLLWLLNDAHFFAHFPASYFFAGSFTGFLVKWFGWETYRRFYAIANPKNFERTFEQHFGIDLAAAERAWKRALMERPLAFEPDLSSAARRKRLMADYDAWQFWLCLEEAEALLRDGEQDWQVIWCAASVHTIAGNYRRALELLQALSERDEVLWRPYRANLWLQIGHLHDLLGERENAITAYQRALQEPDYWDEMNGSTHDLARRSLREPFTERELWERWRKRLKSR